MSAEKKQRNTHPGFRARVTAGGSVIFVTCKACGVSVETTDEYQRNNFYDNHRHK